MPLANNIIICDRNNNMWPTEADHFVSRTVTSVEAEAELLRHPERVTSFSVHRDGGPQQSKYTHQSLLKCCSDTSRAGARG